jgi:hypothetical protein
VLVEVWPELLAARIVCSVHEPKQLLKTDDFPPIYSSADSDEKEWRIYQAPAGVKTSSDSIVRMTGGTGRTFKSQKGIPYEIRNLD